VGAPPRWRRACWWKKSNKDCSKPPPTTGRDRASARVRSLRPLCCRNMDAVKQYDTSDQQWRSGIPFLPLSVPLTPGRGLGNETSGALLVRSF
jgi:hypothetical protein